MQMLTDRLHALAVLFPEESNLDTWLSFRTSKFPVFKGNGLQDSCSNFAKVRHPPPWLGDQGSSHWRKSAMRVAKDGPNIVRQKDDNRHPMSYLTIFGERGPLRVANGETLSYLSRLEAEALA